MVFLYNNPKVSIIIQIHLRGSMIELQDLIPRRFLESSPLAQGCVFDILKVFIKRAAGVAGKVLCFVIVSLPMFFHLKLHILNS